MNDVVSAPQPTRADYALRMAAYCADGAARAEAIANKGPLVLDGEGRLEASTREAYRSRGFYVFEDVVGAGEIEELRAGVADMLERAPARPGAPLDANGWPAYGHDLAKEPYIFIKPLSDPWDGTRELGGRHPHQMTQPEPEPEADAPERVVLIMWGMCHASEACLRVYGHPKLLAVAATINGSDFTPFTDTIFVKHAGLGGSVAWRQNGVTHWMRRTGTRRSTASTSRSNSTRRRRPTACGSCRGATGRAASTSRRGSRGTAGTSACPTRCRCYASPATSPSSTGRCCTAPSPIPRRTGGSPSPSGSAVVQVAINARARRFADEIPFAYQPFAGREDDYRWTPETVRRVIQD